MKDDFIVTLKDVLIKREILVDLVLDVDKLKVLAHDLELNKIIRLKANFKITPIAKQKGIYIEAKLNASVIHECVVTLDPVKQVIDEIISIKYTLDGEDDISDQLSETLLSNSFINSQYDVEKLEDNQVNLHDIVREYLSLSLDMNPRVSDAHFSGFTVGEINPKELTHLQKNLDRIQNNQQPIAENPFSLLAQLKEKIS